jgi:hypothetical protein
VGNHIAAIRDALKRMNVDAIAIGKELVAVKSLVPRGEWGTWLKDNFKWTTRTAANFMAVYQLADEYGHIVESEKFSDLPIKLSALYLLARDTTPDSVRAELFAMAKEGTEVTHAMADQKIAAAKARTPKSKAPTGGAPAAKLFDAPDNDVVDVDDDRLDVYERARDALNELKGALPPSARDDPDEEMFDAMVALENRIKDAYWEVVTGEPPTDESAGFPAPKPAD